MDISWGETARTLAGLFLHLDGVSELSSVADTTERDSQQVRPRKNFMTPASGDMKLLALWGRAWWLTK